MAEMCNIFGKRRNRNTGQVTERTSQLHKDLLEIGKSVPEFNRKKANRAFFLSQTDKFLKDYNEQLIFDSDAVDAEPILASFYEAAKIIMPEVKVADIRDVLAKKFGEGEYSFEQATEKMLEFNKQMQGGITFMGTIKPSTNGKYKFEIVFNAVEEQNALIKTMANRIAAQTLLNQLEKNGATATEGIKSIYSTVNPETIVKGNEGLLKLIEVRGGIDNIHDFAKEIGHFVVGSLGKNNPLYQRLWATAKAHPEIMRELLGEDEYLQYRNTPNETVEFMGHLVGRYLEELSQRNDKNLYPTFKRLLSRAIEYVKSRLAFSNREYKKMMYDAKYTAYTMAKSFMGDNFKGTLENALERKETLEGNLGELIGLLNKNIRNFDLVSKQLKDINPTINKNYKTKLNELITALREHTTQYKEAQGIFSEEIKINNNVAETTMQLINFMCNEMAQAVRLLDQQNKEIIEGRVPSYHDQANVIKYTQEVYRLSTDLCKMEDDIFNNLLVQTDTTNSKDLAEALRNSFSLLNELRKGKLEIIPETGVERLVGFETIITAARRNLGVQLLSQINGNQFIAVAQHVGINNFKLNRYNPKLIDIGKEILDTDINPPHQWLSRWIDSLADNPDIINQLVYETVELKKYEANKKVLDIKDQLVDMYRSLKHTRIRSTEVFFEKDDEGNFTGNLISERNWGQWEKEYKEWKENFDKDYWKDHKEDFNGNKAEMFHNNMYLFAFGNARDAWHNAHSTKIPVLDKNGQPKRNPDGTEIKILAPAILGDPEDFNKEKLYHSKQYGRFLSTYGKNSKEAEWLKNYIKLKKELDSALPFGATNMMGVRAPQFMGTTTNKLSNAFKGSGTVKKVFGIPLREHVLSLVTRRPDDLEFGGEDDTYGEPDVNEDLGVIYDRKHINAISQTNRLPMYGVRKLEHMEEISTDLMSSTLAYASMSCSYEALNEVVGALEQVQQLQQDRHVDNDFSIKDLRDNHQHDPASYSRLCDYMQQQVYNNYCDSSKSKYLSRNKILRKLAGKLTTFSSLYFLGFNMHSAITNAYTAWNEMVKEATGEDYNIGNFLIANACYQRYWIQGLFKNVLNIGLAPGSDLESYNKMDLFLRMFDVQNENERKFRDWHIETPGYGLFRGYKYMNLAMLPYSMTDQWMQSIAFMASARHTKLIQRIPKEDGTFKETECTLWKAYTVKDNKLVLKGDPSHWYIKDKNLEQVQKILKKKETKDLTPDELKAIYVTNPDGSLPLDINMDPVYQFKDIYIPFDTKQENLFRLRCRAINNRMHGVYNKGDGGAYLGLALGGPIASLKKYAIGLIDRRFARARYDFRKKDVVQGSYVTMCNLIWDAFSVYNIEKNLDEGRTLGVLGELSRQADSMSYIYKDKDGKKSNFAKKAIASTLQVIGKLMWGIAKIAYIGSTGGIFNKQYLRDRGFSDNQIYNIRRVWGDIMRPFALQMIMAIAAPPDEPEKDGFLYDTMINPIRHTLGFDNDEPSWFSELMTKFYLFNMKHILPGDKTVDDEIFLDEGYTEYQTLLAHGVPPFSFQGILYYQTYRAYLEQIAFSPFHFNGMINEFKSLTSSALPCISALADISILTGQLSEAIGISDKTDEDIYEMIENGDYNAYKKYNDGKEIYQKGANAYWYKWAKHMAKVGPTRSFEMWKDGYASKEAMEYFRGKEQTDLDKSLFGNVLDNIFDLGWFGGASKDANFTASWTTISDDKND